MKIAILGANGFIGRYLSDRISNTGNELVLFSRKFGPELEVLNQKENVSIVEGDFLDTEMLSEAVIGCDVVYHLISSSIPLTSWEQPLHELEQNIIPTIKFLGICSKESVKKIVFISSAGTVYGEFDGVADENTRLRPFSPYGISKVSIEFYLEYFRKKAGINYDIFRLSNLFGPGLDKKEFGVINTWLRNIKEASPIKIIGDGQAEKDFIYIDDAVEILADSLNGNLEESRIFNVCSGQSISLLSLTKVLFEICKKEVPIIFENAPKSDNQHVRLSNKKLLREKGIKNFTLLEEGVKLIWNEMQ